MDIVSTLLCCNCIIIKPKYIHTRLCGPCLRIFGRIVCLSSSQMTGSEEQPGVMTVRPCVHTHRPGLENTRAGSLSHLER